MAKHTRHFWKNLLAARGDILADGHLAVPAGALADGGLYAAGVRLAALHRVENHRAAGKLNVQVGPNDDAGKDAHHQQHNGNAEINLFVLVKVETVCLLIHRREHLQTAIFYAGP